MQSFLGLLGRFQDKLALSASGKEASVERSVYFLALLSAELDAEDSPHIWISSGTSLRAKQGGARVGLQSEEQSAA